MRNLQVPEDVMSGGNSGFPTAAAGEKRVMKELVGRLTTDYSPYNFTNPDLQVIFLPNKDYRGI